MDLKIHENKKHTKEKEEEEKLIIDEFLSRNVCHACFKNLIKEEGKITNKETSKNVKKLKDQLLKARSRRDEIIDDYEKLIDQENYN